MKFLNHFFRLACRAGCLLIALSHTPSVIATEEVHQPQASRLEAYIDAPRKPNACDARLLQVPTTSLPRTNEGFFNPLVIPQFLLIDVPFGFLKQIAWTVLPEKGKSEMIANGISEQAKKDSMVSSLLSSGEIDRASSKLGALYGSQIVAPNTIDVKKNASVVFVNEIVRKQLENLGLPCQNPERDFPALTQAILGGFETCIKGSTNDDEYSQCTKNLEQTAHFRVGHLALQIMLRDALSPNGPTNSEEKQKLEQNINAALANYEMCAFDRVVKRNGKDKELQTKVCVGEAVLRTVRSIGVDTIEARLKPSVADTNERQKIKDKTFSNLRPPACPMASLLKTPDEYSNRHYDYLQQTFAASGGVKQFKTDLFGCADQLSEESGKSILSETISSHPALIRQYADASGHLSDASRVKISTLSTRALEEAYRPCVARLKATKASRNQSIINPGECEDEVTAVIADQLIQEELPVRLSAMIAPFKDPQNKEKLEKTKLSATKNFESCQKSHQPTNQTSMMNCLTGAVNLFAEDYAVLAAEEKLGKDYIRSRPDLSTRIRSLISSCVQARLAEVKELAKLSESMGSLGLQCNAKIQSDIVPTVATDRIKENFREQGLDPSSFVNKSLPAHIEKFRTELSKASNEQEQNKALETFQASVSAAALDEIANKKTAEYFPVAPTNLSPNDLSANIQVHQRVSDLLQNPQTRNALLNPVTSTQALNQTKDQLVETLAMEKVRRILDSKIKNAATRIELSQKLRQSLRTCQVRNKNKKSNPASKNESIDCASDFEKTATWEIYRAAVNEALDEVLASDKKSDPAFANAIKEKVTKLHMNTSIEAQLKASSSDEQQRDTLISSLQNRITGTVVKEIFHHKIEDLLPNGPNRFQALANAEEGLDSCLNKLPSGITSESRTSPSTGPAPSESCLNQFIKTGALNLSEDLVAKSAQKYVTRPESRIAAEKIKSDLRQNLQTCLAAINGSPQSPAFSEAVMKCSTLHASNAAIDLALLRDSSEKSRLSHQQPAPPQNDVEKLVVYVSNACFYGYHDVCQKDASELKQRLHAVANDPQAPGSRLRDEIYQSPIMDSMITGALAQELEETLNAKLKVHKSPDDKVYNMEMNIFKVASPDYLGPLLKTPEGAAFVSKLKSRIRADKSYNPAKDPTVAQEFKSLLIKDRGPNSFTDIALAALAKPTYDQIWSDNFKNRWSITVGLGMWWKNIQPRAVLYQNVMNTPSGQRARDYFYEKVLLRSLNSLTANEKSDLLMYLPTDLSTKIINGKSALSDEENRLVQRILYQSQKAELAKKIAPLTRSEIGAVREEIEKLLNQAASEVK